MSSEGWRHLWGCSRKRAASLVAEFSEQRLAAWLLQLPPRFCNALRAPALTARSEMRFGFTVSRIELPARAFPSVDGAIAATREVCFGPCCVRSTGRPRRAPGRATMS